MPQLVENEDAVMKILVVLDGTGTSQTIADRLSAKIRDQGLAAEVKTFVIDQVPGLRLQSRGDINEYVGRPEHLTECIGDTDILVVHLAPVDASTIGAGRRLKLIACARGGPQNVDVAAAKAHDIPVVYCPGRNAQAVAEFTIGMMIAAARGIVRGGIAASEGQWQHRMDRNSYFGPELMGKTLGILGFGSIGRVVARMARALDMRVLAYDALPLSSVPEGVDSVDLATLLGSSDFITLHARLTPGAPPLIGAAEFALMKKTAILVNTARGELVDEKALREAIDSKAIAGAALDVLAEEPPSKTNPLLCLPNVIVTPHIAGISTDTADWSARLLIEDILRYIRGETPEHVFAAAAQSGPSAR